MKKDVADLKKIRYGIIAALDFEEQLIREKLNNIEESELLSIPVYRGTIGNNEVVLMRCGMGKVSAGISTQVLIDNFHPDYIINTGCAGALSPDLKIGDIVLSSCVVEWDLDLRAIGFPLGYINALGCIEIKASDELRKKIECIVSKEANVFCGMIVSGDQFVSKDSQRQTILENFPNALCAEMEGAAVGHVCVQNKIPFCIIRAMSDTADGNSGVSYEEFSVSASRRSASWLVKMLES